MSNPTGDAINAFFGVAPHFEGPAAELRDEISAVKVTWTDKTLYIAFNPGEITDAGLTSEYAVKAISEDAKLVSGTVFVSAEFIPLMSISELDTSDEGCWTFGPSQWEGFEPSKQSVAEGDEPFTTDVVNGDLDDAETAFNS